MHEAGHEHFLNPSSSHELVISHAVRKVQRTNEKSQRMLSYYSDLDKALPARGIFSTGFAFRFSFHEESSAMMTTLSLLILQLSATYSN